MRNKNIELMYEYASILDNNKIGDKQMDNVIRFDWVDFYKELAGKLLQYKDNRKGLVEIVKKVYDTTGINMPTLELDGNLIDIDPFTFYGIFNKSKMKESNRKSLLSAIASLLGIGASVP